jgi:hypothetical protein
MSTPQSELWGGAATRKKRQVKPSTTPATQKPAVVHSIGGTDPASRFYYDGRGFFMDADSLYIPLSDVASVRRQLKQAGCFGEKDICGLRPDDRALNQIQTAQFVSYAGPLAGYRRGLHTLNGGKRVLVTESPVIPCPQAGRWQTLEAVLCGLLVDEDERQMQTVFGWIKTAFESLKAGRYRPGQALALAGPAGCGKSLLIDLLRVILGGRSAGAYEWLSGRTNFNLSCAAAELLVVDDKAGSSDPRARATLAANLKSGLFSGEVRIEGKHKNAFDCRPLWRLVFALNDEPENLLVLPPLNEDVRDKITLLRCRPFTLPMPAHTLEEKAAFWQALVSEVPAFLHWLESWQIPEELREARCGVTFYHHPALVEGLQTLAPESQLWQHILDAAESFQIQFPAKLTAAEVQRIITAPDADHCHAARSLLNWPAACGAYLARLAHSHPERVRKAGKLHGIERWELLPPTTD